MLKALFLREPLAGAKEVITRCGLCGIDCGMKAYVKDKRVLAVMPRENDPETKGFMCDMGLATPEIVHASDREHRCKGCPTHCRQKDWAYRLSC